MKKAISLVLMLICLLTCFCACESNKPDKVETDEAKVYSGIKKVELDFVRASSPALFENTVYMAVSKNDNNGDLDERYLVSYDIETGNTENVYESKYPSGIIMNIICDGKWLLWVDQDIWGASAGIYVKNIESGEVQKITLSTDKENISASYKPALQNERVYWIDHNYKNDTGVVNEYDCKTKKIKSLCNLNENYIEDAVGADEGKVVWSTTKNGKGTLYLYDILSGEIKEFITDFNYARKPLYSDGYIKFQGMEYLEDMRSSLSPNYWYNINTGEITEIKALDTVMFQMSKNYVAASAGGPVWYYKRDGDKLTQLEQYSDKIGDGGFYNNDTFVMITQENEKFYLYINSLNEFI